MGLWVWKMVPCFWKFFKSCHLPNGPLGSKNGPLDFKIFQILSSPKSASGFEKWPPGFDNFSNLVISKMGLWVWKMGPWIWKFFKSCHLPNGPLGLKNGPLDLKIFQILSSPKWASGFKNGLLDLTIFQILSFPKWTSGFGKWAPGFKNFSDLIISQMGLWV